MKKEVENMSGVVRKNTLNASQRLAAELFATNDVHKLTVDEVAERVGVTPRTIYRWKQDRDFIAYQNSVAEVAMEDAIAEAYTELKNLLRHGNSEKTKLEALKLILQNRGKLKDTHEHTHEVKQTQSLDDLEAEIIEMEKELLD
jgi:AcrR family transcriptional regulator